MPDTLSSAPTDMPPDEPVPAESQPPAPTQARSSAPAAAGRPTADAVDLPEPAVLVLRSSDSPTYRDVSEALDNTLRGRYTVEHVTMPADDAQPWNRDAGQRRFRGAIAIGSDAAELAARVLDVPVVFCQVFDYEHLLSLPAELYGVAALPPPALQLESWKRLAPAARSVGMIVGANNAQFVDSARRAAERLGIDLHAQFAGSDREVLYRIRRLVPTVDGLWLIPDSDIMSPRVLQETLEYALRHGVHSIVFNDSLLEWGGLISVTSRPDDVAAIVARVLEVATSGRTDELRRVTPLSDADVEINEDVASTLGLARTARGSGAGRRVR